MLIEHKESGDRGLFFIGKGNDPLGELDYTVDGNTLTILHTEVSDHLRGKGAGKQLVSAAVDYARSKNMSIIPKCSFAQSIFERVEEFHDVLKEN